MTGEPIAGPDTFSDEMLMLKRVDLGAEIKMRRLIDDWYRERIPDWTRITIPMLSAANGEGKVNTYEEISKHSHGRPRAESGSRCMVSTTGCSFIQTTASSYRGASSIIS